MTPYFTYSTDTGHEISTWVDLLSYRAQNQSNHSMHLSDFFIGKPGNICVSEAVQMNLPVIVKHDAATLVQEKYVNEWITDNQIGIVLNSWQILDKVVGELIKPENLARYRHHISLIHNQGLFETSRIIMNLIS
jgi:1,2-diacylglycerol 3-beta-galactosyltransferase